MLRYAATALLASLGFAAGVSGRAAERTGLEAAPTPRFADVTLATGVRLRYAEQGDRGGPAVILLHGYSDSWFSWSRVMPLIPARYHVIAPDQRGHGDSDKPEGGYAMRDMAGGRPGAHGCAPPRAGDRRGPLDGELRRPAGRGGGARPGRAPRARRLGAGVPDDVRRGRVRGRGVRARGPGAGAVRPGVPGEHDSPPDPGGVPRHRGRDEPAPARQGVARHHDRDAGHAVRPRSSPALASRP